MARTDAPAASVGTWWPARAGVSIQLVDRSDSARRLQRVIRTLETSDDLPLGATELWIFGSYARGASHPGDLDLILVYQQRPQDVSAFVRSILGGDTSPEQKMNARLKRSNNERIDIIYATSLERALAEHTIADTPVLIWRRGETDWQLRIDSIPERPGVTSHPRPVYVFDLRQVEARAQELADIGARLDAGVLSLIRIPVDSLPEPRERDVRHLKDMLGQHRLEHLFLAGLGYLRSQGKRPEVRLRRPRLMSTDGAIWIDIGRPRVGMVLRWLDLDGYDDQLEQWVGIPTPRGKGSVELWVVRRTD